MHGAADTLEFPVAVAVHVDIRIGSPLEEELEVEVAPVAAYGESIDDFGYLGASDGYDIVVVGLAVAVDVAVFDVAQFGPVGESRRQGVDLLLGVVEAVGDQSEALADGASHLGEPRVGDGAFTAFDYLVAGEGEVASDIIPEFVDETVVSQVDFETAVDDLADVCRREAFAAVVRGHHAVDVRNSAVVVENAVAAFVEIVSRERQLVVEEFEVHADIEFVGTLPSHFGIALLAFVDAVFGIVRLAERGAVRSQLGIGLEVVILVGPDAVVADLSERSAELHVAERLGRFAPESLLGENPAGGYRREETVALVLRELHRTVVSGVELGQVLVLIGIGHTTDVVDVTDRQRGVALDLLAVESQQGRDGMVAESAVVVQSRFDYEIPAEGAVPGARPNGDGLFLAD